jgi:hypothetical protein
MTNLVAVATLHDGGMNAEIHLDLEDAYECLRLNFAEEISPGDRDGIIFSLEQQEVHVEIVEQDIDLSDVLVELPKAPAGMYAAVYNAINSHAWGTAAGIEHCACADWTSADDHNFDDHVTRAVLAALSVPTI